MRGISLILFLTSLTSFGQGPFPPPAGQVGTTAIPNTHPSFVAWTSNCEVVRGPMDITDPSLGLATFGVPADAIGPSDPAVVSFGDGGSAVCTFDGVIYNGPGFDFAVFENSFSDEFLELAFVEVSSDGLNFYRFPATSYTPLSVQVDGFGVVDATNINNLAGKYRAQYGTPFDLSEMDTVVGLDINAVSHIRLIDCVGSIDTMYATYDQYGTPINEPFTTPFASGGFDLDAIGVINFTPNTAISEFERLAKVFPNPAKDQLNIEVEGFIGVRVYDLNSRMILTSSESRLSIGDFEKGHYFLEINAESGKIMHPFIKQ